MQINLEAWQSTVKKMDIMWCYFDFCLKLFKDAPKHIHLLPVDHCWHHNHVVCHSKATLCIWVNCGFCTTRGHCGVTEEPKPFHLLKHFKTLEPDLIPTVHWGTLHTQYSDTNSHLHGQKYMDSPHQNKQHVCFWPGAVISLGYAPLVFV